MNLKEPLLRGIYAYGFEKPSAIQQRAIIPCIKGELALGGNRIWKKCGILVTWLPGRNRRQVGRVGEGCATTPTHIWDGKTPLPGRQSTFSIYGGNTRYWVFFSEFLQNFQNHLLLGLSGDSKGSFCNY